MNGTGESFTIGSLAEAAAVSVETIRYYQRKGLVDKPHRPAGGIRRYGTAHAARLAFIKSAQRLGFTLDEVADLLAPRDGSTCAHARARASEKLASVQSRLKDLRRIERALTGLIDLCDSSGGPMGCPLIAALEQQAGGF